MNLSVDFFDSRNILQKQTIFLVLPWSRETGFYSMYFLVLKEMVKFEQMYCLLIIPHSDSQAVVGTASARGLVRHHRLGCLFSCRGGSETQKVSEFRLPQGSLRIQQTPFRLLASYQQVRDVMLQPLQV